MKKFLFAVSGVLLLAGWGCGQSPESAVLEAVTGGQVSVDEAGQNIEVRTKEGTTQWGEQTRLPESWPSDAPAYPGASVAFSSVTNPAEGRRGTVTVMLQTKDLGATVLDYYNRELAAQGWTIESTFQLGDGASLNATKAGRALALTIAIDAETGTSITETVDLP